MMSNQTFQKSLILFLILHFIFPCASIYAAEERRQEQQLKTLTTEGKDWYSEEQLSILKHNFYHKADILNEGGEKDQVFYLVKYYDQIEPPRQNGFLGRYTILAEDSFYFLIPAFAVMGAIYLLPENVSNWDKDNVTLQHGLELWPENVSSWEWDNDANWINFIGHPYCGSSYYIYARHYGFSRLESFWFSFTISSFYEIGIEAWAEPVSIQDMIFTPLLGSLLGELLLPLEHQIKTNNNEVMDSRLLGTISLIVLDPFGHVIPPLKRWVNNLFSEDVNLQLSPIFSLVEQKREDGDGLRKDYSYGLRLIVRW